MTATETAPAATEEADAQFLRMTYRGSCVWFGRCTRQWWALLPRGRSLICAPTAQTLGAQLATAAQPSAIIHHPAEPP